MLLIWRQVEVAAACSTPLQRSSSASSAAGMAARGEALHTHFFSLGTNDCPGPRVRGPLCVDGARGLACRLFPRGVRRSCFRASWDADVRGQDRRVIALRAPPCSARRRQGWDVASCVTTWCVVDCCRWASGGATRALLRGDSRPGTGSRHPDLWGPPIRGAAEWVAEKGWNGHHYGIPAQGAHKKRRSQRSSSDTRTSKSAFVQTRICGILPQYHEDYPPRGHGDW
jgi:hypothetical protein